MRRLGSFVRIIDASEAFQFPRACFLIEPFGIARFANFQRRVDKYLDEISRASSPFDLSPHDSALVISSSGCNTSSAA